MNIALGRLHISTGYDIAIYFRYKWAYHQLRITYVVTDFAVTFKSHLRVDAWACKTFLEQVIERVTHECHSMM